MATKTKLYQVPFVGESKTDFAKRVKSEGGPKEGYITYPRYSGETIEHYNMRLWVTHWSDILKYGITNLYIIEVETLTNIVNFHDLKYLPNFIKKWNNLVTKPIFSYVMQTEVEAFVILLQQISKMTVLFPTVYSSLTQDDCCVIF